MDMTKIYLWLGVICFLIVLGVDVYTDLNVKEINHSRGLLLRSIGLLPCLGFFTLYKKNWWAIITVILMVGFNYLNLFDGFYNLLRGYSWFFLGSDDSNDARTDNFFQSIPIWLQGVIKIGGSLITIIIYLFTFKNKNQ